MLRTENGWLTMLPLAFNGETASAVTSADLNGEYELVIFSADTKSTDDRAKIGDTIEKTVTAVIQDGKLTVNGKTYPLSLTNGKYTFTLEMDGEVFYGACCKGTKNGKTVMTLSAVSDRNRTLWAVGK